jgi:integrase
MTFTGVWRLALCISWTQRGKPCKFVGGMALCSVRAGIKDFRFHDLRHSAASCLAMNGASLAEIAEVLGHKTLAIVKSSTWRI